MLASTELVPITECIAACRCCVGRDRTKIHANLSSNRLLN
jgi:hypothetical protein